MPELYCVCFFPLFLTSRYRTLVDFLAVPRFTDPCRRSLTPGGVAVVPFVKGRGASQLVPAVTASAANVRQKLRSLSSRVGGLLFFLASLTALVDLSALVTEGPWLYVLVRALGKRRGGASSALWSCCFFSLGEIGQDAVGQMEEV